jgi:tetratricopeptide (TPR) repeat protein
MATGFYRRGRGEMTQMINRDDIQVYCDLGYNFEEKEEYDKAIEAYTKVLELDSDYLGGSIFWLRGRLYRNKKCYKKAFSDISKATVLSPYYDGNLETLVDIILRDEPNLLWEIEEEELKRSGNFFIRIILKFIKNNFESEIYKNLIISVIRFWRLCKCSRYKKKHIYQYTTITTLEKIRNNHRLRLNPASYQNDPGEGKVFYNFLQNNINKKMAGTIDIDIRINQMKNSLNSIAFIRSLTGLEDSMVMWNSPYGDNGKGVSIGITKRSISKNDGKGISDIKEGNFSTRKLSSTPYMPFNMIGLYKVQYIRNNDKDPNTTREERVAEKLLNEILTNLEICLNELNGSKGVEKFFELLPELFTPIAHLIKYKSYAHEKEYRLIYIDSLGNNEDKKYIKENKDAFQGFYIETEDIFIPENKPKIVFGPKVDELTMLKYRHAFKYDDLPHVKIEKSTLGLR